MAETVKPRPGSWHFLLNPLCYQLPLTLYLSFFTRFKSQLFYLFHTSPIQLILYTPNTAVTMSSKDFIIKHMNADHQDSLTLFLQAYCGITSTQAKNSQLEEISTSNLIITAQGTRYSVPKMTMAQTSTNTPMTKPCSRIRTQTQTSSPRAAWTSSTRRRNQCWMKKA